MHSPLVSIIIVNWNGRELLTRCLAALSGQTRRDFEVVVVDNGSSDGSAEFLRREHPGARLVALDQNTGFAGGNNAGLAVSRGRFIVTLNNDMEPCPDWLEKLAAGFERDPRIGSCVGKMFFYDRHDIINSAGDVLLFDGQGVNRGLNEKDRGHYEREEYVPAATAGAAAYRREMLEETGFFDERYFAYFEDVDLSLRAIRRGWRCLYVPSAVAYHRHMSTTKKMGEDFLIFHATRNKFWNILKDFPNMLIVPALLYSLGGSLFFALRNSRKGAVPRNVARGIIAAFERAREIRKKRIHSIVSAKEFVHALSLFN